MAAWSVRQVLTCGLTGFFGCFGFRGCFCLLAGGGLLSFCLCVCGSSCGSVTRCVCSSVRSCSSRRTWYKIDVKMLATNVGEESNWFVEEPSSVSNALTKSKRLAVMGLFS